MPINEPGFKWIITKELWEQDPGCGTTHSGSFPPGDSGVWDAAWGIFQVFIRTHTFSPRWLLPPQALNAYYLPNKNQMGESFCSQSLSVVSVLLLDVVAPGCCVASGWGGFKSTSYGSIHAKERAAR